MINVREIINLSDKRKRFLFFFVGLGIGGWGLGLGLGFGFGFGGGWIIGKWSNKIIMILKLWYKVDFLLLFWLVKII